MIWDTVTRLLEEPHKESLDEAKHLFLDLQGKGMDCQSIDMDCISDAEREIHDLTRYAPLSKLLPEEKRFEPFVNNPPVAYLAHRRMSFFIINYDEKPSLSCSVKEIPFQRKAMSTQTRHFSNQKHSRSSPKFRAFLPPSTRIE